MRTCDGCPFVLDICCMSTYILCWKEARRVRMNRKFRLRHDAHVRADSTCAELHEYFDPTPGGQSARGTLATSVADGARLLADRERHKDDRHSAARQIVVWRRPLRGG